MKTSTETLSNIYEANLCYLLFASRLLHEDKAAAISMLGMSEQIADVLCRLTPDQLSKLARANHLLLRFRFDDHTILASLGDKPRNPTTSRASAALRASATPAA
jgi:flagellar transcriptional activator FlhD